MDDPMYFEKFILPSGLQVFYQHRNLGWFACQLVVGVGQRQDPPGKEELSHLLEHELTGGTLGWPKRTFPELRAWVSGQGFEFDFGATALDHTVYGGKALNRDLEKFLRFLGDYVLRPSFDGDGEHEKAIIRAERRDRTSPRIRQIERRRLRALFGNHRLASCQGWATDKVLAGLTMNDLHSHHDRYYGCKNMTLVVVGGCGREALSEVLGRVFTPDFSGRGRPEPGKPPDFGRNSRREYRSKKPDGKPSSVIISYYWLLPGSINRPALMLVRNGLGLLADASIREILRAAYDVSCDNDSYLDHVVMSLQTEVAPKDVARTVKAMDLILGAAGDQLSETLPRLVGDYRTALGFLELTAEEAAEKAAMAVSLMGAPRPMSELLAAIEKVTADDVRRLVREHLDPGLAYVEMVED